MRGFDALGAELRVWPDDDDDQQQMAQHVSDGVACVVGEAGHCLATGSLDNIPLNADK
jgi:hypothetical protein